MKHFCCSVCFFNKNETLGCKATRLKWVVEELVMSMPVIGEMLYPHGLTECEWFERNLPERPDREVEMNTDKKSLIYRDTLKNEIQKVLLEVADTPLIDEYTSKLAVKLGTLVMKKIDDAPEADAAPVGKWENPYPNDIWDCYRCSECGSCFGRMTNFCPDCGSRLEADSMKGVRENGCAV